MQGLRKQASNHVSHARAQEARVSTNCKTTPQLGDFGRGAKENRLYSSHSTGFPG